MSHRLKQPTPRQGRLQYAGALQQPGGTTRLWSGEHLAGTVKLNLKQVVGVSHVHLSQHGYRDHNLILYSTWPYKRMTHHNILRWR